MAMTSSAVMIDNEVVDKTKRMEFNFKKFDSDPFHPKTMKWDSDNATSEYLIGILFKNVEDSKVLTIQKETDPAVDGVIRQAHKNKGKKGEKGKLDIFQIRFVVDGIANSLRLTNATVEFIKDFRENNTNFFVFTLKTKEEVKKGGAGV